METQVVGELQENGNMEMVFENWHWEDVPGIKIDEDLIEYFKGKDGAFTSDIIMCQILRELQKGH